MRWSLTKAVAAAAAVLLVTACGSDSKEAAGGSGSADAITVGVIPIVDVAPIYLGVEKGFFDKRDLDVTLESSQGGAAIVPGVVSGQSQFGFSNVTSLLLGRSQGIPLKIVAAGNYSTGEQGNDFSGVVVGKDSKIKDAGGLAGTTVAVNTLKNIGDTTVRQSVEKAGGNPDEVSFVELPFPDMPAALSEGRIDAAWLVEPFLTIAKNQGATEIASNLVDTQDNLMISAYFTSDAIAQQDPDLVARFTEAMHESLDYAAEHPHEVRDILQTYTKIDPEVAAQMVLPKWSSEINTSTVELLADLAAKDGLIPNRIDADGLLP